MKFVHFADCHLGGWREPELNELNFSSFQYVMSKAIEWKVDFVLIAGDLFDSAYPPIETLKDTFREFRRLKEANIPVFLIAGSHDYSVSGKTFLDVLERAGLCKNVFRFEERDGKIILLPTIYKDSAIYGFPGKKSGLEVDELLKVKLNDSPGLFRILMLHTTLTEALPSSNLNIKSISIKDLPQVDYYALGHLHSKYNKGNFIYSGPTFPNAISELEDLKNGSFYLYDNGKITREEIKLKEVLTVKIDLINALNATELILSKLNELPLRDKILILKLSGFLQQGKISDIDFAKIELFIKEKGAYSFLKSTTQLLVLEPEINFDYLNTENLENKIITQFEESNPSKFNNLIPSLMRFLQMDKLEDEKIAVFQDRLLSETKKVLGI
jgi:DNA repair protein SbcD/Mre11